MKKLIMVLGVISLCLFLGYLVFWGLSENERNVLKRLQNDFAKRNELPILYNIKNLEVNSKGETHVNIDFVEMSNKPIKSIRFYLNFSDKNNKELPDEISGGRQTVLIAGEALILKGIRSPIWKTNFINKKIVCANMEKIEIEYMDRTVYSMAKHKIIDLANNGFLNYLPEDYSLDGVITKECQEEY